MPRPQTVAALGLFYTALWRLLIPFLVLRLFWRSRKQPGYRQRWWQRLGLGLPSLPAEAPRPVWIHAVSVGETLAIAPLINRLLEQQPLIPVLVTSTTAAGAAQVERLFADRVLACWVPFDTPGATRRTLRHFRPRLLVLVETELWPNLLAAAQAQQIPVALLNGRLSARSARGYARVAPLIAQGLASLSVVAAQHRSDARRLQAMGALPARVIVTGSVKFDIDLGQLASQCRAMRSQLGAVVDDRRVLVAASTHAGEETIVLNAFRRWRATEPRGLLVLAPRHPQRVAGLLGSSLFDDFRWQRRSLGEPVLADTEVVIWDTLGELAAVMGLAELVVVGGSLVPHGGHNPLEAAAWGAPVVAGPYTHNFAATYRALFAEGAVVTAADSDQLAAALCQLMADPADARRRGNAGRRLVDRHRGAIERQLDLLSPYLLAEAVGAGGATR